MDIRTITTPQQVMAAVWALSDPACTRSEAQEQLKGIRARAQQIHAEDAFQDAQRTSPQEYIMEHCVKDNRGLLAKTIENFLLILNMEPRFQGIHMNALKHTVEDDGRLWASSDESKAIAYIESVYHLSQDAKFRHAFEIFVSNRTINPLKQLIESEKWDSKPRLETLLTTWLDAEDTPYTREVSRLIFAGGIHRLYNPGCKFDVVPVLCGKQGAGKSTLVRFLAMDDAYSSELTTINGKEGMENVEGFWIMELPELKAFQYTSPEQIKAFLTRQSDKYRKAYGREVSELPRTCIFIGTTNDRQFISDKTGGRRFFPVDCFRSGWQPINEQKMRQYIRQAWAEAYYYFTHPDASKRAYLNPYPRQDLIPAIQQEQDQSTVEDLMDGIIIDYLNQQEPGSFVCVAQLWTDCFASMAKPAPTKKEQMQIAQVISAQHDWMRCSTRRKFDSFGFQRTWQKQPP